MKVFECYIDEGICGSGTDKKFSKIFDSIEMQCRPKLLNNGSIEVTMNDNFVH